jgi:hypothetical protein
MSPGTLQKMRDKGEIEFIQIGNKVLYEVRHILELIEKIRGIRDCFAYCFASLSSCVDLGFLGI